MNADLLKYIPPDAATVVEIGGAGDRGARYGQINPFGRYIAAGPDGADLAALAPDGCDCLIYDNVLQKFADPLAVLKTQAGHLRGDGQVIAAVPNVQHWAVVRDLLAGRWESGRDGNLRFFTLETLRQLFADAGLAVHDVQAVGDFPPQFEEFQQALAPVLDRLGQDRAGFRARAGARQFIVRAAKKPPVRRLLIQAMLGETKLCSRVRISEPDAFLATIPGVRIAEQVKQASLAAALPGEDKVFIWQRIWPASPEQQKQLLKRGYLIIAEIDDDPLRWADSHRRDDFFAFRAAHAVQTSTEPLAEFLRGYNPNVAVFPNQMAFIPPLSAPRRQYPVTVIFCSVNREQDWQAIMPELNAVTAEFKDAVTVKVVYDRLFFDALTTPHKEFVPLLPYPQFIATLASADIALLPLEDNRFNSMKSDLKFLECASRGVAALAGPTVYERAIRHGETGLIFRSPAEFGGQLRRLIADHEFRAALAGNAYGWVREHRLLGRSYRARYEWYAGLLARLPELTAELLERAPELR